MVRPMEAILTRMIGVGARDVPGTVLDSSLWLEPGTDPIAQVTAAFLVAAAGDGHPMYACAAEILAAPAGGPATDLATFYRASLGRMRDELDDAAAADPDFVRRLEAAAERLSAANSNEEAREAIWATWFPQAVGILGHEDERIAALREARTVTVVHPAADPITDPAREVLFTANVLLTVPSTTTDVATLPYPADLRSAISAAAAETQRYWFDHPIQVGVEPAANELMYGLRGFDAALNAEFPVRRVTCLLSVSVTHEGLGPVAKSYVEAELARSGGLRHVDVIAVTERDTRRLVDEVIIPVIASGHGEAAAAVAGPGLRAILGVDGEYGRHYSFLKAVAALWHVALDPAVRATFKFDLDQVFPQAALVAETGRTAFGHLTTPLWGASARDGEGREVKLGMLAGALVNERDIGHGLFTPDVEIPTRAPSYDEYVFYSVLPQAISTRAEMMVRYDSREVDGVNRALERIHVTGGTNGILVDALRRHRPFTPSFVGRAEDQAYVLSVLDQPGPRLAYAHAAGLIMRHDKEAFAGQAMAAAHVGKLIGDDLRILVFSAYAKVAAGDGKDGALDRAAIGRLLDPFTGGFVSAIPVSVVAVRMALRTLRLFATGQADDAREYAIDGSRRVGETLAFTTDTTAFRARARAERSAWDSYYDALDALEAGLGAGEAWATGLRARALAIMNDCRVRAD